MRLVQITETVAPEVLFGADYPYFSSVSAGLLAHSQANALELIARLGLGHDHLVVEIASNDGYMLRNFAEAGIPVLGIDPAPGPGGRRPIGWACGPCRRSSAATWPTRVRRDYGTADLIIANNVLAHVADLNGVVDGIASLLAPAGSPSWRCPTWPI